MLFIIGLGLNNRGISKEGLLTIEKCKKIYLENYTVNFPYELIDLKLSKRIFPLKRGEVESNRLIDEAKGRNIALLVYGSPLFATTHMGLILDAEKQKVKVKVIYAASVFDAIAETGLQLYKFGKTTSLPAFDDKYETDFLKYVKENQSINAHSLILIDIGLSSEDAFFYLDKAAKNNVKLDKIIVCSQLGTENSQIYYDTIYNLRRKKIEKPFCFIIPGEMHFLEQDALERFEKRKSPQT
ncbi:MAG: diphthine synthase [Candidatus Nanoarchaeia archaeon]|nr:diphthine synthase [Candidatus Nanoarchaeia archaeon]MDD5740610.1 diphthine synthase [Candidatus Nanoarchaeia archaeon]